MDFCPSVFNHLVSKKLERRACEELPSETLHLMKVPELNLKWISVLFWIEGLKCHSYYCYCTNGLKYYCYHYSCCLSSFLYSFLKLSLDFLLCFCNVLQQPTFQYEENQSKKKRSYSKKWMKKRNEVTRKMITIVFQFINATTIIRVAFQSINSKQNNNSFQIHFRCFHETQGFSWQFFTGSSFQLLVNQMVQNRGMRSIH